MMFDAACELEELLMIVTKGNADLAKIARRKFFVDYLDVASLILLYVFVILRIYLLL